MGQLVQSCAHENEVKDFLFGQFCHILHPNWSEEVQDGKVSHLPCSLEKLNRYLTDSESMLCCHYSHERQIMISIKGKELWGLGRRLVLRK